MRTAIGATAVNIAKPTNLGVPMIHAFLDNIRYITIELNGLTLYDTRDDVPCDMDKWRETRARFPARWPVVRLKRPTSETPGRRSEPHPFAKVGLSQSVTKTFSDTMSGARDDRPGLAALMEYVREGDTVVVWKLNRLGRNMLHILQTVNELTDHGVTLVSVTDGIDSSTPAGRMMIGVLESLAEYEHELTIERTALKRAASRAIGTKFGRPRKVNDAEDIATAKRMKADGHTGRAIARYLGVSRATLCPLSRGASVPSSSSTHAVDALLVLGPNHWGLACRPGSRCTHPSPLPAAGRRADVFVDVGRRHQLRVVRPLVEEVP
jgi:DNA invertase Pin-like site-specific DNA recombinase